MPHDATLDTVFADLPAAPLCVGYSGGMDSTVLLHALAAVPGARERGLRAWHVHHGLHPDADTWQAHCTAVCARLEVPLQVSRVVVNRDGDGPEAAARRARHAAFAEGLAPGEVLALAHHQDDQAETFLLRALRASAPAGLGSMRRWRALGHGRLWRPLLTLPRSALLAYAHAHGLHWIDDPGNDDAAFDRNFLRHEVLPRLQQRWPHVTAAFARSAQLCGEADALLDDEDAAVLAACSTADPACLSRSSLAASPAPRRARVLRRWIATLGLPPLPAAGIASVERDLLHARRDAEAHFEWHGARLQAWRDLLHADFARAPLPPDWRVEWRGDVPLTLPGGGIWRLEGAAAFDGVALAHTRRGGERLTLPGRTRSHALKHVLQDLGVPPWQRDRLPLLSSRDGAVLAAGDLLYAQGFDAWLRERGARLVWRPHSGV